MNETVLGDANHQPGQENPFDREAQGEKLHSLASPLLLVALQRNRKVAVNQRQKQPVVVRRLHRDVAVDNPSEYLDHAEMIEIPPGFLARLLLKQRWSICSADA